MPTATATGSLFSLPNLLSMSRVVLAAIFPFAREPELQASLVAAAGASDFLDGWLARSRHAATRRGALLDPITDRIFVLVALVTYVVLGQLTVGQCIVLLLRDIATTVGFLVARVTPSLQGVTFKARWPGKVVTAVQIALLLAIPLLPRAVGPLVVAVGLLSVWAIADYTLALRRARAA